jgi:retron-type reverse transcriptase
MAVIVERNNLARALRRVQRNQGSPGIDGMTVAELAPYLRAHWPGIREALLAGTYQPSAVRRHQIPKPEGRVRTFGTPTVLDRFLQQAVLQVLQPRFDPTLSEASYGFRPGRTAHDAVCQAQRYVQTGRRWVVDIDLEQFFDRVHHDILMRKLPHRIADRRVLGLIRRYLAAGMMANVLLDEVDKELERRGHCSVRYADDGNVYVGSKRAGERVRRALVGWYADLQLRINDAKSAVAPVGERSFLGFRLWATSAGVIKRGIAPKALTTMKDRVRAITSRSGGRSIEQVVATLRRYLVGWGAYFRLVETPRVILTVEQWLHRRLRMLVLRQWRRGRTRYRELRRRGVQNDVVLRIAWSPAVDWALTSTPRIAGCGPACPVVWEGGRREFRSLLLPIPIDLRAGSSAVSPFAAPFFRRAAAHDPECRAAEYH